MKLLGSDQQRRPKIESDMHLDSVIPRFWAALIFSFILCFAGCTGTSAKFNRLSLGMTKEQVIRAIGTPDSVSAKTDTEFLVYHLASPKALVADERELTHYFVRLKNGRVDAFGQKGDFDSTKEPTLNLNIKSR